MLNKSNRDISSHGNGCSFLLLVLAIGVRHEFTFVFHFWQTGSCGKGPFFVMFANKVCALCGGCWSFWVVSFREVGPFYRYFFHSGIWVLLRRNFLGHQSCDCTITGCEPEGVVRSNRTGCEERELSGIQITHARIGEKASLWTLLRNSGLWTRGSFLE